MTNDDIERLEKRITNAEDDTHTHGERPRELTKEEKDVLNEVFDVEPFTDNGPCPVEEVLWE